MYSVLGPAFGIWLPIKARRRSMMLVDTRPNPFPGPPARAEQVPQRQGRRPRALVEVDVVIGSDLSPDQLIEELSIEVRLSRGRCHGI